VLFAAAVLTACSIPVASPTPAATATPAPLAHRIGVRIAGGDAEFYDRVTGARFVPRGTNYVDFAELVPGELWQDYIFGAGTYRLDKVRAAFERLSQGGYNTVRLFFDHCGKGPSCIGSPSGDGLNPVFLDHMVEVMRLAGEQGLYLILTANTVPLSGRYWESFSPRFEASPDGFATFFENGYYLHAAGVAMQAAYWTDLMSGLAERKAPFEVMLGWELQNEYWLFSERPPLALTSGIVTISSGQSYDMSDPAQKRQMVTDGTLYWMETLAAIVRQYDPEGLVTVGFFPPNFPNDIRVAPEWYRDTASLLAEAPVDFWDFHAYPPPSVYIEESMTAVVENFGILDYRDKPVLMGEVGAFRSTFPNLEVGTRAMQEWIMASCGYGFDGWLTWEYYNRPASDAVWGLENDLLFDALAPVNAPESCGMPLVSLSNLAFGRAVAASHWLSDSPPANAVDGTHANWNAGAGPGEWIQVDLGAPVRVTEIRLQVSQYPEGETVHRLLAGGPGAALVEVHRFSGFTRDGDWLAFQPDPPLEAIQFIQVETLASPSWAAWYEIEVYGR
jgi:hypothetical protein